MIQAPSERQVAQGRAVTALARLRPSYSGAPVHLCISDSAEPCAWSWADGRVCVTLGLTRLLNDDELTAVLSHELGHLTHVEGGCMGFALGGARNANEQRADSVGIMLLRMSGVPPAALARALIKVRDAPTTAAEVRFAIEERVALLPT